MAAILQMTFSNSFYEMKKIRLQLKLNWSLLLKLSVIDIAIERHSESSLVQTWCWTDSKPLPEPMMTEFSDAILKHYELISITGQLVFIPLAIYFPYLDHLYLYSLCLFLVLSSLYFCSFVACLHSYLYRKICNIRRTKSKNLSDCCLVLQLPFANPLKPGVMLRMKM